MVEAKPRNDKGTTRIHGEHYRPTAEPTGWICSNRYVGCSTNHVVSNCEVDFEVDSSPDWKPVELVVNSSGYVAELGDDSGPDGRSSSKQTFDLSRTRMIPKQQIIAVIDLTHNEDED
jgi:hypothetical protein